LAYDAVERAMVDGWPTATYIPDTGQVSKYDASKW